MSRRNLPSRPTTFIGREDEVADVVAMLRRPAVRLVTLTGLGGSGKTRLSLRAAAELLEDFPDRVYFVPLAAIGDRQRIPSAIAAALSVKKTGGVPLIEVLK